MVLLIGLIFLFLFLYFLPFTLYVLHALTLGLFGSISQYLEEDYNKNKEWYENRNSDKR